MISTKDLDNNIYILPCIPTLHKQINQTPTFTASPQISEFKSPEFGCGSVGCVPEKKKQSINSRCCNINAITYNISITKNSTNTSTSFAEFVHQGAVIAL